jgi:hypothetical protein
MNSANFFGNRLMLRGSSSMRRMNLKYLDPYDDGDDTNDDERWGDAALSRRAWPR